MRQIQARSRVRPMIRRGLSRLEAATYIGIAIKFHELRKANRIPPPKVLGCIAFTFSPHARAKGGAALSISLRRSFTLSILPSDVSGSSVTICTNFGA
jgi:hypothetical protein